MPTGAVSTGEMASDCIVWQRFSRVERVTGIEPALSAWEADVLPLNYTRERADGAYSRGAIGSLTDSCAAPRSTSGA